MKATSSYMDLLGPRIYIKANNDLAKDIMSNVTTLTYTDDEKKADILNLTIANPASKFTDDPRFKQGVVFSVVWGYSSDLSKARNVVINRVKPSFKNSGMPLIEMVAFDLRYEMAKVTNPKNWGPVSSSEVAMNIAKSYNLETDIEESKDARKQARVQPAGTNDIMYLHTLAGKLNWDFYVEGNKLHFHHKRYEMSPYMEYTYFTDPVGTLLEFTPEVDLNKPPKVAVSGTNLRDNKGRSETKDSNTHGGTDLGNAGIDLLSRMGIFLHGAKALANAQPVAPLTKPSPETDHKVIKAHATALSQKIDMNAVKANLKVIGTPRLKARDIVRILGVGQTYSGNWRISSTKHILEAKGGTFTYITELKLSRNALGGAAKDRNKDKPPVNNKDTEDPVDYRRRVNYANKNVEGFSDFFTRKLKQLEHQK